MRSRRLKYVDIIVKWQGSVGRGGGLEFRAMVRIDLLTAARIPEVMYIGAYAYLWIERQSDRHADRQTERIG